MKSIDKILVLIVLLGVSFMTYDHYTSPEHAHHSLGIPWYGYFGLFFIPIGLGSSNILMRKMKGIHFVTLALFKYVFMVPLLLLIFLIKGFDWDVLKNFDWIDWVLIILAAMCQ